MLKAARLMLSLGLMAGAMNAGPASGQTSPQVAIAPNSAETPADRAARMHWWHQAKFGMFIHWGLYAVPAGTYDGKQIKGIGEWIMNHGKIPVDVYAKYAEQFNPTQFNADEWMQIAQDAGMKYVVITAKHHDGFCMFHTAVDGYNIYDGTPFHRDPLKELAEAAPKHDIKLGFYYSQSQDWHHPGGAAAGGHWDKAQDGDYDKYLAMIAVPQVRELLSNYGQFPAVLWFDTPKEMTPARAALFYPDLELKPELIINNRLGGGFKGDTETPEQRIPANGFPGRDWETCMTINDTWGYKSYDTHFKSAETLLFNLVDIASKGGNYLLNVGPDANGVIPQPEVDRLKVIGAWLKVNGEAIYGCGPSCFGAEFGEQVKAKDGYGHEQTMSSGHDWRCTTQLPSTGSGQAGKTYIHIFKWPNEKFALAGVKGTIAKAYLLADPQHTALAVSQNGENATVALPDKAPDPIASVLCLEMQ